MQSIKTFFGRILAATIALALILITLPLTLMLASITLILGALAAFHLRRQMQRAAQSVATNPHNDIPLRQASGWFASAPMAPSARDVVIEQVEIDGVWQVR